MFIKSEWQLYSKKVIHHLENITWRKGDKHHSFYLLFVALNLVVNQNLQKISRIPGYWKSFSDIPHLSKWWTNFMFLSLALCALIVTLELTQMVSYHSLLILHYICSCELNTFTLPDNWWVVIYRFSVTYIDSVVYLDLNWKFLLSANNAEQGQEGLEPDRVWECVSSTADEASQQHVIGVGFFFCYFWYCFSHISDIITVQTFLFSSLLYPCEL